MIKILYPLLILFLSVVSCQGQAHDKQKKESRKTTKLVRTLSTDKYANIQCSLQDKAGNLWFGTNGEGIYQYDGHYFMQFTTQNGLTSNKVWSMIEDDAGNIWAGTDDGICRLNRKQFVPVAITAGTEPYLSIAIAPDNKPHEKNEVWSVMKDKTGQLWFGMRIGLYCYKEGVFSRFLDDPRIINKDSLQLKMIECMLEDKNGTIWIGSGMVPGDEGICRYDPVTDSLTAFKPEGDGWIRYMIEDKSGDIWIGTRNRGIWMYDGKDFSRFKMGDDIGLSALADKDGGVWFSGGEKNDGYSSDGGVWLYKDKTLRRFAENAIGGYGVWCMLQDNAGNIWFGTRNIGLYRYDGKSFTCFSD